MEKLEGICLQMADFSTTVNLFSEDLQMAKERISAVEASFKNEINELKARLNTLSQSDLLFAGEISNAKERIAAVESNMLRPALSSDSTNSLEEQVNSLSRDHAQTLILARRALDMCAQAKEDSARIGEQLTSKLCEDVSLKEAISSLKSSLDAHLVDFETIQHDIGTDRRNMKLILDSNELLSLRIGEIQAKQIDSEQPTRMQSEITAQDLGERGQPLTDDVTVGEVNAVTLRTQSYSPQGLQRNLRVVNDASARSDSHGQRSLFSDGSKSVSLPLGYMPAGQAAGLTGATYGGFPSRVGSAKPAIVGTGSLEVQVAGRPSSVAAVPGGSLEVQVAGRSMSARRTVPNRTISFDRSPTQRAGSSASRRSPVRSTSRSRLVRQIQPKPGVVSAKAQPSQPAPMQTAKQHMETMVQTLLDSQQGSATIRSARSAQVLPQHSASHPSLPPAQIAFLNKLHTHSSSYSLTAPLGVHRRDSPSFASPPPAIRNRDPSPMTAGPALSTGQVSARHSEASYTEV